MKELYIDFDGVIVDSIPQLYKELQDNKIDMTNELEKSLFFSKYDFSNVINDENILNDSIESIKKLKESKLFQISILTHINSLEEGMVKINYIRRYFKDVTIVLTPKRIEKTEMVHSEGAILVDDYSENLKIWKSKGGIPIKFEKESKTDDFVSINNLSELINIFGDSNES